MQQILVIEDDPIVRDSIMALLEAEGFAVNGAENGVEGVEQAQRSRPDLIICDVMMPELNGYQVLANLQKTGATALIPFIFLTAKASHEDLRAGMDLGADDYITKPFKRIDLLNAITRRLQKSSELANYYNKEQHQLKADLDKLTYYDSLTGLLNRTGLYREFNNLLSHTDNAGGKLACLIINLHQFNRRASSLTNSESDFLIQVLSARLKTFASQFSLLARIQSDQFVLVDYTAKTGAAVDELAQNIVKDLSRQIFINEREILVNISLGIAVESSATTAIDLLLRNGELALVHAGIGQYKYFDATVATTFTSQLSLEADLQHAIERNQLEVYYQPQVCLKNGFVCGVEALVRWRHPIRGLISPAEFIPLAEKTGFIIELDNWVLKTACQELNKWQKTGLPPLGLAVNLSARQFDEPNLSLFVSNVLNDTGFAAQDLELELTETAVIQNNTLAATILQALKELGVRTAIDDFGTGYSALSYLRQFPLNTLKIDRSFVSNITSNFETAAITSAIIQMAHTLSLKVIAEGVETEAERTFLQEQQCDVIQGYLVSRPMSATEFIEWWRDSSRLPIPFFS